VGAAFVEFVQQARSRLGDCIVIDQDFGADVSVDTGFFADARDVAFVVRSDLGVLRVPEQNDEVVWCLEPRRAW
jgi:hypothetical protein